MLCLSAHKFNGPKGIGALYVRKGIRINPLIHGGGQENGLRAGTSNTPLIVGLGEASKIAKEEFEGRAEQFKIKRSEIEHYFVSNNYGTINFTNQRTAPHIISVSLNDQDAEDFLIEKNQEFAASTGSACGAAIIEISHVIKSLGTENNYIRISIV